MSEVLTIIPDLLLALEYANQFFLLFLDELLLPPYHLLQVDSELEFVEVGQELLFLLPAHHRGKHDIDDLSVIVGV